MLNDVVDLVRLDQAIEVAPLLTLQNQSSILRDGKEILIFKRLHRVQHR